MRMSGVAQPTGTVTLLFSDIEGSTQLLHRLGRERYAQALDQHRRLLRDIFARHGGYEVDYEGDAFFVTFARAEEAVAAAAEAQSALAGAVWPEEEAIRVRMGLHTGEPVAVPPKYVGLDVHQAARIMAAGHGGQVLLSEVTRRLADQEPERFAFRDLGEHRLKDLSGPQRLYQLLVHGLPAEFAALKTLGNRPTNLPVQPNRLVGRERELAEAAGLVRQDEVKLVTLTGPGGTGKTRLALQLAAELLDDFPDGAFVVFLAPLADPKSVLPAVAATLGLREVASRTLEEVLTEFLRGRRLFLLLDNLEHLLAAAPALGALLAGAPGLTLLVTSRAPLRLAAEREFPVPPLAVSSGPSLADALGSDAVTLFLERARAVLPDFRFDDATAPVVAEICRRVDGLPLAIELAAARVRALPPEALLTRLDRRLKILAGGARDAPERQQTLRATIDWSYQLLEEDDERIVLARLAAFVGGFGLDAAEVVCDPGDELAGEVLDGLFSLVEKNLVRRGDDLHGEPRFFLLETIREYALERLREIGEEEATRARHAAYYADLAEGSEPALRGPEQRVWLERLDREHDNLRAAAEHAIDTDPRLALRLVWGASRFWEIRAHWREGLRLTQAALERAVEPAQGSDVRLLARGQEAAGSLLWSLGEYAASVLRFGEAVRLARAADDHWLTALALCELAWSRYESDPAGIHGLIEEGLELARSVGDAWLEAFAAQTLSLTAADPAEALEIASRSQKLYDQAGDAIYAMRAQNDVAWYSLELGLYERAIAVGQEVLVTAHRMGDNPAVAVNNIAIAELLTGRPDAAADRVADAIHVQQTLPTERVISELLLVAAGIAAAHSGLTRAGYLRGGAKASFERMGGRLYAPHQRIDERLIQPLRARDPSRFDNAHRRGTSASVDELLASALEACRERGDARAVPP